MNPRDKEQGVMLGRILAYREEIEARQQKLREMEKQFAQLFCPYRDGYAASVPFHAIDHNCCSMHDEVTIKRWDQCYGIVYVWATHRATGCECAWHEKLEDLA